MAKKTATTKPKADVTPKAKKVIVKATPKVAKRASKAKPEIKTAAPPSPKLSRKSSVTPIAPRLSRKSSVNNDSKKALDLCLLMDCTGSMSSWIERSKSQLKAIIDS